MEKYQGPSDRVPYDSQKVKKQHKKRNITILLSFLLCISFIVLLGVSTRSDDTSDSYSQAPTDASDSSSLTSIDLAAKVDKISNFATHDFFTPEGVRIIDSYAKQWRVVCYVAPENGEFILSVPLREALTEYGDDVIYRVLLEIRQDGHSLEKESADVQKEKTRLSSLGYTFISDSPDEYFLYMQATKEQLRNFACDSQYGYFMRFYFER